MRRRLKSLQADGVVEISGRGRGTRYLLLAAAEEPAETSAIPLSKEGREVQKLV